MKEKKEKIITHEKFMTQKELTYIELLNRRALKKLPSYKLIELCFDNKNNDQFVKVKKEKSKEINEVEKGLFSVNINKSKKRPRIVESGLETTASNSINSLLIAEEICDLILKIKYNFNEIILQEEEEYNPMNVSINMKNENCEDVLIKIQEHKMSIFSFSKVINHLKEYFCIIEDDLKKRFINLLMDEPFEENNVCLLIESIYKGIPVYDVKELLEFKRIFFCCTHFLLLSIVFILKNPSLSQEFYKELNETNCNKIFQLRNKKYIWQFFGILCINLDDFSKKRIYLLLNDKVKQSIKDKESNVKFFLNSIGVEYEE